MLLTKPDLVLNMFQHFVTFCKSSAGETKIKLNIYILLNKMYEK